MLISLNHEEPDRVPRFLFYTPEVQSKICSILNIDVVDNPYLFDIEVENDLMLCYRGISNIPGVYQEKYIGDKKLVDQIGNTITFFTRAHIVARDKEVALDEIKYFQKIAGIIK